MSAVAPEDTDIHGTFAWGNPLTMHFGAGCLTRLGDVLKEAGVETVQIVSTRSVVASDFFATVRTIPQLADARVVTIGSHVPVTDALELARSIRESGAQAVVAVGGGSAIDAAKLGAYGATASQVDDQITPEEFTNLLLEVGTRSALPVYAVPTTLSAAELYGDAGFTSHDSGFKVGVQNPEMTPAAVFYDPLATAETPQRLWASTGIRAVDHATEVLTAPYTNPITEALAIDGLRELLATLPKFADGVGRDSERLAAHVAAWKGYTLPSVASSGLSHKIGRVLGAKQGIPHGITSCVILAKVLRFHHDTDPAARSRIDWISERVLGKPDGAALIEQIEATVETLGLPSHFDRSQIDPEAEARAVELVHEQTGVDRADLAKILAACIR